jgi:hypothetical protein
MPCVYVLRRLATLGSFQIDPLAVAGERKDAMLG